MEYKLAFSKKCGVRVPRQTTLACVRTTLAFSRSSSKYQWQTKLWHGLEGYGSATESACCSCRDLRSVPCTRVSRKPTIHNWFQRTCQFLLASLDTVFRCTNSHTNTHIYIIKNKSQVWWLMTLTLALGRQTQTDLWTQDQPGLQKGLRARGYTVRPFLNNKIKILKRFIYYV